MGINITNTSIISNFIETIPRFDDGNHVDNPLFGGMVNGKWATFLNVV
jgi:hypothetical protein